MNIFSQIITELESDANYSQLEIAKAIGSKPANISRIKIIGTTPNYFLGEKLIKLHAKRCPDSSIFRKGVVNE